MGTKWRIGERQVPLSRRELTPRRLSASEAHPLALTTTTATKRSDCEINDEATAPLLHSASAPRQHAIQPPPDNKSQELIVLQDGDVDPLGVLGASEPLHPVNDEPPPSRTHAVKTKHGFPTRENEPARPPTVKDKWRQQTDRFLVQYADETFTIKAKLLEGPEVEPAMACLSQHDPESTDASAAIQKTRTRLKELDHATATPASCLPDEAEAPIRLSQTQYAAKVKAMETQLMQSWTQDQKVDALRVAIKAVKLLADTTTAPHLYPCAYVLVTDVLDTFGHLVYQRIHARASEDETSQPLPEPLKDKFTSSDVNVPATETCRNWFYKTACIRELLPRIYIEIALLPCYRFLCDPEYPHIVMRLANMIKGISDPLVAIYTRLYLALTASDVLKATTLSELSTIISTSVFDYLDALNWYRHHHFHPTPQLATLDDYLALQSPALAWLFDCIAPNATLDTFDALLGHVADSMNHAVILEHVCTCFHARLCAARLDPLVALIHAAPPSRVSKCRLYSVLARQLSTVSNLPPPVLARFFNASWAYITSQDELVPYLEGAAASLQLLVAHCSHREALFLLKDVVKHVNAAKTDECSASTARFLGACIEHVVEKAKHDCAFFTHVIPSRAFLTLLSRFQHEDSIAAATQVLRAFVRGRMRSSSTTSDPFRLPVVGPKAVVAQTLLVLCRRVHDALDSLSTATARTHAVDELSAFVTSLGYVQTPQRHDEDEALLLLYTDCRGSFYKLARVTRLLSFMVLRLAMDVHRRLDQGTTQGRERRTRRVGHRGILQSCLAFAHITIPSMECSMARLALLVSAASVAFVTQCIPQMEALVKLAIVTLAELDLTTLETADRLAIHPRRVILTGECGIESTGVQILIGRIASLMSLVVYAPSGMERDAFYFVTAVMKAVMERLTWNPSHGLDTGIARIRVRLMVVQLYALWGQKTLAGGLEHGVRNKGLYRGDDAFQREVQARFSASIDEVVRDIKALGNGEESVAVTLAQIELMLDFVNLLVPVLAFDADRGENVAEDSRQPLQSCSSAVLIQKCMVFSSKKAQSLELMPSREIVTDAMKKTIGTYFHSTCAYIVQFLQERTTRAAGRTLNVQAMHELGDVVQKLSLARVGLF